MKTEPLGPLEQKVMDVLWKSSTPLKPLDVLHQLKGDYAYTTIMTILKRLADKEVVSRKMSGKAFLYSPCSCKEKFIKKNLSGIINGLVDSYGQVAIANFVDVIKNDKKDLALLKKYLESQK
ncbi:MAG: BlaI/MecI/CopY family transcriptional regulator [Patescibacteria group bacterium]